MVAELDYLVATRVGVDARLAVCVNSPAGAWGANCGAAEIDDARIVTAKYQDPADRDRGWGQRRAGHDRYRAILTLDRQRTGAAADRRWALHRHSVNHNRSVLHRGVFVFRVPIRHRA